MASTSAMSMAMPLIAHKTSTSTSFFNPLTINLSSSKPTTSSPSTRMMVVQSSFKEKAITALTVAILTASMVVPEVTEAASGVTLSLNNFLLSIGAGGVVLTAILGAIIGVSNFDPVKRG